MALRQQINEEIVPREEILDASDGARYKFRALPDANLINDTFLATPQTVNLLKSHWMRVNGAEYNDMTVRQVLAVHRTLVPETWIKPEMSEPDTKGDRKVLKEGYWQPDEKPDDVTEVAKFATQRGSLFTEMAGMAMIVLGIVEDAQLGNMFDKAAAGNSSTPTG